MLIPNKKQFTRLLQFAGVARFAYNWALAEHMEDFRAGRRFRSHYDLRKEFTVLKHLGDRPWLFEVSNNVTKQAIKDCSIAYSNFFRKQKSSGYVKYTKKTLKRLAKLNKKPTPYDMNGHPHFKCKKNGYFRFYQDTEKIRFTATHVKLESLTDSKRRDRQRFNFIRLAEHGRIPTNAKYINPRVSFDGEHWWISVSVEIENTPVCGVYGDGLGIDLGIKSLAVLSDASVVANINKTKTVRKLEKRRRRLQRRVSRLIENSKKNNKKGDSYEKTRNTIKSEKKLLRVVHRLTNIRQNHLHQATTAIIKRKPSFICLEDLNVRGMMANKHLAKVVQEQKFYEFRKQIEYKAEWEKIQVIIADRFYPSSKTCIACGKIKHELKLSDRVYKCDCGNVIDRDLQAAINLKRYADNVLKRSAV